MATKSKGGRKRAKRDTGTPDSGDIELGIVRDCVAYDIHAKIAATDMYDNFSLLKVMDAKYLDEYYVEETGLADPVCFTEGIDKLGIKVPRQSFTVLDVKKLLGGDRKIQVIEVNTQNGFTWTLDEFVKYYRQSDDKRKHIYNVLSLEFTHTKLANVVNGPKLVEHIDWVRTVIPKPYLTSSNETLGNFHPKVQNYCLMSVAGCYTDFHIDFGGTSVWYHIFKGEKIFWLIRPTEHNIKLYEEWLMSGALQNQSFFADAVARDDCVRVHMQPGHTLIIPSGWIHAVYTPVDSLVFGGNFLHNQAIEMQLRVHESEATTKITRKFRYPNFADLHWYVAANFVKNALGHDYVDINVVHAEINAAKKLVESEKTKRAPDASDEQLQAADTPTQSTIEARPLKTDGRNFNDDFVDSQPERVLSGMQALSDYLTTDLEASKSVPTCIGVVNARNLRADLAAVVVYAKFDAEQRDKMKANAEEIADKMDETEKVEEQVEEQKEEEDDDEYRPSSSHETKPTPQKRRASKDHRKSTDHVEPKVMRSAEVASLPVDDLVPLGKTPLQSMLRKTQNMVKTDDMKLSRLEQEKLVQMRSAHAKAELDNGRFAVTDTQLPTTTNSSDGGGRQSPETTQFYLQPSANSGPAGVPPQSLPNTRPFAPDSHPPQDPRRNKQTNTPRQTMVPNEDTPVMTVAIELPSLPDLNAPSSSADKGAHALTDVLSQMTETVRTSALKSVIKQHTAKVNKDGQQPLSLDEWSSKLDKLKDKIRQSAMHESKSDETQQ